MQKGLFIVIEGIDGAGKGVLLKELFKSLYERNKRYDDIVVTREPSYRRFGARARSLILTDEDPTSNKEKITQFFIQDRIDHHAGIIEPAIQRGAVILCDRERLSTICYQGAQGMNIQDLINHHEGMLEPDIILICDCPVELAMKRRLSSSKQEKFEIIEFQEKVKKIYDQARDLFPHLRIAYIDTSQTVENSIAQAIKILEPLLPH